MAFRALVAGLILALSLFSPAQAVVPELRQPAWAELTQEQKLILAPLSRDWNSMEAFRKKKWLGIAKRYPTMKPEEQARVQRRMQDWASLTPEQRTQARAQYKTLKTAPPEKKEAIKQKWEQYKEVPGEERKRLAEKAAKRSAKPHALTPKLPAAAQPLPAAVPAVAPPPPSPPTATAEAPTPTTQGDSPAPVESPAAQPAPAAPTAPSSPPVAQ